MLRRTAIAVLVIVIVASISVSYFAFRPLKTVQIKFAGVVLNVELAKTQAEQAKGLSGRDSLPADHGMLFVFDNEDYWAFWMNGMRFPLDIIWFNAGRQTVFIEQSLQPCPPDACPSFAPSAKAMYVLEVNAGFVVNHNVSLGDTFTFVST